MKQRSLPKMAFLYVFTLGFYRLYWLAKTRKELLAAKPDAKIMRIWVLLVPYLLVALSLVAMIFAVVQETKRQQDAGCVLSSTSSASTTQAPVECQDQMPVWSVLLFYLACASFYPITAIWYWGYSQAVDRVTEEKLSFALTMIVLLAVPDIFDMLIVQDNFNKVASSSGPPEKTPAKKTAKAAA